MLDSSRETGMFAMSTDHQPPSTLSPELSVVPVSAIWTLEHRVSHGECTYFCAPLPRICVSVDMPEREAR